MNENDVEPRLTGKTILQDQMNRCYAYYCGRIPEPPLGIGYDAAQIKYCSLTGYYWNPSTKTDTDYWRSMRTYLENETHAAE